MSKSKSILTPTVATYPHSSMTTLSLPVKFTKLHLSMMSSYADDLEPVIPPHHSSHALSAIPIHHSDQHLIYPCLRIPAEHEDYFSLEELACTQSHHNHGISRSPIIVPIGLTTGREEREQSPSSSFTRHTPPMTEADAGGFLSRRPTVGEYSPPPGVSRYTPPPIVLLKLIDLVISLRGAL